MIVGAGDHGYEKVDGWATGRTLGIASGVAADSDGCVYVIDREPNPAIVVFGQDGVYRTSWAEDILSVPHDIWIDGNDRIYTADCGDHSVRIFNVNGDVIDTLLTDQPDLYGQPFNRPTRAVCAQGGDLFVSDGYGQHHIHRFSSEGELKKTWGGEGSVFVGDLLHKYLRM